MTTTLIGIDWATDPARVGLALGTFSAEQTNLIKVQTGHKSHQPLEVITHWLQGKEQSALLAIDAPLGWPVKLGELLVEHSAGEIIEAPASQLFRRSTDHFIREKIGKQSLDVGADRIARTAHSALELLGRLRKRLGREITLGWDNNICGIKAIEVYPAATLAVYGISSKGYKATDGGKARRQVLEQVAVNFEGEADIPGVEKSSDGLDALICLLAAKDFLAGRAMGPPAGTPVKREGWIWVRDPDDSLI